MLLNTKFRNHILQDTLHMFRRAKLSLTKHLKVTFVREPAVDAGGPLKGVFFIIFYWKLQKTTPYFVVLIQLDALT